MPPGISESAGMKMNDEKPILTVEHLTVAFDTDGGRVRAVEDVSFSMFSGKTLGIVGESGCGKSVTALSLMRLLPRPSGMIESGSIHFGGTDLVRLTPEQMHRVRGRRIAMIFQEPMTALNPVHAIGRQIGEVFRLHDRPMDDPSIRKASVDLLQKVGIPDPVERLSEYPHQISGGMRQRVMIAMAMAGKPGILIADEPTTALDVTIQAQILEEMKALQAQTRMALLFITHDLGVIAEICDEVVVMYAGKVAESAPVNRLFEAPAHPYTMGLLSSIPRLEYPRKTKLDVIRGMVPGLLDLPEGCRFQNRCPYAMPICQVESPPMRTIADHQYAACWLYR